MTRLLILIFVLNTLLPSAGFAAMLSPNTNETSNTDHNSMMMKDHCSTMNSQTACDNDLCADSEMLGDLCKAHCATSTGGATHISLFSFDIPFMTQKNGSSLKVPSLYTRPILPELRPPLA